MLNYWYEPANTIAELAKNPGKENGCSFPADWYIDGTNTLTMEVTIKNAALKKESDVKEEVPAQSLTLSQDSLSLQPGSSQALVATIQPAEATEKILWHSDNQKIAQVAQDGTITADKEGETVIRALTFSGKEAVCQVKVGSSASQEPSAEPSTKPGEDPGTKPSAQPTKDPGSQPGNSQAAAKGTTFTAGQIKYKITSTAKGKAAVQAKAYKSKKAKSLAIPATVKKNGTTYAVTSVGSSAFKNCKKLKKATIGNNVATIGKNAFSGCKTLRKITVKTTRLKKIGKNAFKGIHKKAVIKVPKKKLKKYRKLWKKKGQKKTVKIKQ